MVYRFPICIVSDRVRFGGKSWESILMARFSFLILEPKSFFLVVMVMVMNVYIPRDVALFGRIPFRTRHGRFAVFASGKWWFFEV